MSDQFYIDAYEYTHDLEGGRANHKADKGGPTAAGGISLRLLKSLPLVDSDINGDGHVTEADLADLNSSDKIHIYKKYFWDHYGLGQIVHGAIAVKMFSTLVHMRSALAVKILQRALRSCEKDVKEDGLLGPQTFGAVADIVNSKNLLAPMRSEQNGVYQLIVAKDPSQAVFAEGWKNRAYAKQPLHNGRTHI